MNLAQRRVQIRRPRRPISTLAGHTSSPMIAVAAGETTTGRSSGEEQERGEGERRCGRPPDSSAELDLVGESSDRVVVFPEQSNRSPPVLLPSSPHGQARQESRNIQRLSRHLP